MSGAADKAARKALEDRASALGLSYPANIGDDKLQARIDAAEAEQGAPLVVEVVGPRQGRWRAGRRFDATPVVLPLAALSEDEKAALIADPKLSVTTREAAPGET